MSNIALRNASLDILNKSLQVGSLKDLVRARKSENVMLLVDVSGSMGERMRNGRRRIDGLRTVVESVLSQKVTPLIGFGIRGAGSEERYVRFLDGEIPEPCAGTPLADAIDFAREQGAGRAVVISDGMPDSASQALEAAARFGGRIDVVFVGDPGEFGSAFLDQLAKATGGERFEGDLGEIKALAGAVVGLLCGDVDAAFASLTEDEADEDFDDGDEDDDEEGDDE